MERSSEEIIAQLLSMGSISGDNIVVESGDKGGNNRIDLVHVDDKTFVVKWYFSSAKDTRDRLFSEWSFLAYAHRLAPEFVPAAISHLPKDHVALYEFIPGDKLGVSEIDAAAVEQAAEFLRQINRANSSDDARNLPNASEAFFTIQEHMDHVGMRLDRFSSLGTEAEDFQKLSSELAVFWDELKNWIATEAERQGISLVNQLEKAERFISPSDFGFHNVLCDENKKLTFIDFEYAGWDDAAKAISDFFLQPALPVAMEHFDLFAKTVLQGHPNSEKVLARTKILHPLFALKWCCIILNPFVPEWAARSQFADSASDLNQLKQERLSRARKAFAKTQMLLEK